MLRGLNTILSNGHWMPTAGIDNPGSFLSLDLLKIKVTIVNWKHVSGVLFAFPFFPLPYSRQWQLYSCLQSGAQAAQEFPNQPLLFFSFKKKVCKHKSFPFLTLQRVGYFTVFNTWIVHVAKREWQKSVIRLFLTLYGLLWLTVVDAKCCRIICVCPLWVKMKGWCENELNYLTEQCVVCKS